jgi:F-type H+-transporting ATPase subunit a
MAGGIGLLGWVVAVPLYALELLVCFLQAYIFTLLSAVFIGLCIHQEH